MSNAVTTRLRDLEIDRDLLRNGLPAQRQQSVGERLLATVDFWFILLVGLLICGGALYMWALMATDFPLRAEVALDLDDSIIDRARNWALISAVPAALLCVLADRWRPHRIWIWIIAFAWGAAVATPLSYEINTWMASRLNVTGQLNPAAQARPAIFVAPFVEEATKATVLFWVAMAMRHRWIGLFSGISLAGLSGVGFAFVENILYYARALVYASQNPGVTPEDAIQEIFVMRGVMTWFAHPMFTAMTGIGLVIALRSRSTLVRVLAPVAGFAAAALLHMLFNGMATVVPFEWVLIVLLMFVGYPTLMLVILLTFRSIWFQKSLIRARLEDYQRAGWIPEHEVDAVSRVSPRVHSFWQALWGARLISTVRMHHTLTELAYVRDAMLRGTIDAAGHHRERHLLARATHLRARAIVAPWPKTSYPWERRRARAAMQPSRQVAVAVPGSSYSPVNPAWKPPSA